MNHLKNERVAELLTKERKEEKEEDRFEALSHRRDESVKACMNDLKNEKEAELFTKGRKEGKECTKLKDYKRAGIIYGREERDGRSKT